MKDEIPHYMEAQADSVLSVGTKLSGGKFTITGRIGIGGFGVTYRATDNVLGRTIVIKECFATDFCQREGNAVVPRSATHAPQMRSIVELFMREARSLAKLRHPNIVGVHNAFEENGTAYMALDLIDGPDLLCLLDARKKAFSPKLVKDILDQLLRAIEKVHELDLLHRDISPDNIIIEKTGIPVLIDFGAARGDASRRTRAISSIHVVKDGYSPQEFYVAGSMQTPSSDIYALGSTMYHVLSGKAPPNSQARMLEIAGNKKDPCVPLEGRVSGYEPSFLAAIDRAMSVHPSERFQTAQEWRDMIATSTSTAGTASAKTTVIATPAPSTQPPLDIEQSLSKLVEETNEAVRKTRVLQSEAAALKAAEPPKKSKQKKTTILGPGHDLTPEPDEIVSAETDVTDETEIEVVRSQGRPRTRVAYMTPEPTQAETNWVTLAQERQDRQREARAAELEMLASEAKSKRAVAFSLTKDVQSKQKDIPDEAETFNDLSGPLMRYLSAGIFLGVLAIFGIGWAFPNAIPGL